MKLSSSLISLSILCLLLTACQPKSTPELVGTWASANELENVKIEFTKDGDYNIIVGETSVTKDVFELGQIKYKVKHQSDSFEIQLFGELRSEHFATLKGEWFANKNLNLIAYSFDGELQKESAIELSRLN